jgi:Tfp pilus assembly protein PilE
MVFWILGIAALGLLVVVGIGVMAAIAIPRFTRAADRARSSDRAAERLLKQAWTMEQTYRAQKGAYASTLEDLRAVGWEEPPASSAFDLSIVTAGESSLCIEAMSRGGIPRTLSIQTDGTIEPVGCSLGTTASNEAEEARVVLHQGWQLLNAYHTSHHTLPRDLAEITPKIERQQALSDFRVGYTRYANGEFCLSVRPRGVEGPERSVDQDGRFFTGSACSGSVVESFATEPPDHSTGATP